MKAGCLVVLTVFSSCAAPVVLQDPAESRRSERPPTEPAVTATTDGEGRATSSAQTTTDEPTSTAVSPPPAPSAFTPPPFAPPSERSAAPGDGVWTPWPSVAQPLIHRSVVHPHAVSRFVKMDVVAIDLTRTSLHWNRGTLDDPRNELAALGAAGLVAENLHPSTLLVFNGGFQPRHGRWGIAARGVTLQEPKSEGCTVAATADGTEVWMGPWDELAGRAGQFDFVRQTPPCLLHGQQVNPELLQGRDRRFGGHDATRKTRRRSAIGLNADRTILYYAVGTEAEPVDLARGMLAIGSHTALQLDINWNWTRCLLPGPNEDGRIRVVGSLMEGMSYGKSEYFARPSERDFFYVTRLPEPPSTAAPPR